MQLPATNRVGETELCTFFVFFRWADVPQHLAFSVIGLVLPQIYWIYVPPSSLKAHMSVKIQLPTFFLMVTILYLVFEVEVTDSKDNLLYQLT